MESISSTLARRYFEAVSAKEFEVVAGMLAEDIVWHQPGANRFFGTHRASGAVGEMTGGMMAVREGTFELALSAEPMVNGALVAAPRSLLGEAPGWSTRHLSEMRIHHLRNATFVMEAACEQVRTARTLGITQSAGRAGGASHARSSAVATGTRTRTETA